MLEGAVLFVDGLVVDGEMIVKPFACNAMETIQRFFFEYFVLETWGRFSRG